MRAAESPAVVFQETAIQQVERRNRDGQGFAEILPKGQIKGGMRL
jgi:hypothetical protein